MGSAPSALFRSIPGLVVILFHLIFAAVLIVLFYGISPQMKLRLSSSPNTPWGVFTSIFVNEPFVQIADALSSIAVNLLALALLIYLANSSNRRHKPRRELLMYCISPLISATAANMAAMPYSEPPLKGTSGFAYAMVGAILCTSMWDLLSEAKERGLRFRKDLMKGFRSLDSEGKARLAIDLSFFLAFLSYATVSPAGILNAPREAEIIVRAVSIVLGYIETWMLI